MRFWPARRFLYVPPRSPEEWEARDVRLRVIMALRNRFAVDIWKFRQFIYTQPGGIERAPRDPLPKASRDWYTYRLGVQRAAAFDWIVHHGDPCIFGRLPAEARVAMWKQFFKRGRD